MASKVRFEVKNRGFSMRQLGVVIVWLMAPASAMAYIDPGNGAYMVQALFAAIGAALFYLRHPIQSLRSLSRWVWVKFAGPTKRVLEDPVASDKTAGSVTEDVQRP